MSSSGLRRHVVLNVVTTASREHIASIFRKLVTTYKKTRLHNS
jgi:hypothetical protein